MQKKFLEAKSIYDILIVSYEIICEHNETDALVMYNKYIKELAVFFDYTKAFKESNQDKTSFKRYIISIMQKLTTHEYILAAACVSIIKSIDLMMPLNEDRYSFRLETIVENKPLNNYKSQHDILVLPIGSPNIFQEAFLKNKKQTARKTLKHNPAQINANLQNYVFIKKSLLDGYEPVLLSYNDDRMIEQHIKNPQGLKIALVPFTNSKILNIKFTGQTFEVLQPTHQIDEIIIKRYIDTLKFLIQKDCQIAVFPEMILTSRALTAITEFLSQLTECSLKIIICGTIWSNKSNICYVLSGDGEILFKQRKFSPFTYHKGSIEYIEELCNEETDKFVKLLDIRGFGRVLTSICLDYLNQGIITPIINQLKSNIYMVPAYSSSLSYFENFSKMFASNNHGITFMCNCCTPRQEHTGNNSENDEHIGFVCVPEQEDRSIKGKCDYYTASDNCKECMLKLCAYIITIDENAIYTQMVSENRGESAV